MTMSAFEASREIPAGVEQAFAAFCDTTQLPKELAGVE